MNHPSVQAMEFKMLFSLSLRGEGEADGFRESVMIGVLRTEQSSNNFFF